MAEDAAAQHEIERLLGEIERLRALERNLLDERDRIRHESLAEITRLQDALRAASSHSFAAAESGPVESRSELTERARHLADLERSLHERESALAAADADALRREHELEAGRKSLEASRGALAAERSRLAAERRRLEQESDRLAEWEREALRGGPSTPLPTTFHEGLNRLAEQSGARGAPPEGSW